MSVRHKIKSKSTLYYIIKLNGFLNKKLNKLIKNKLIDILL